MDKENIDMIMGMFFRETILKMRRGEKDDIISMKEEFWNLNFWLVAAYYFNGGL